MTMQEIESRSIEIREAMNAENADLDALQVEAQELIERKRELAIQAKQEIEQRKKQIDAVIAGEGEVIEQRKETKTMTNAEVRNTKEYINAYAEYIKSNDDTQCRSLLTENVKGGVPVPEIVDGYIRTAWESDDIMRRVRKSYIRGNLKVGFEISSTGAAVHEEGDTTHPVAEETLVLGIRNLVPVSIKKWITISDEAMDLGGEEFLRYIYDELTHQIAHKAADVLVDDIMALNATGSATEPRVQELTAATIAIDTIASAIGLLSDRAANPVVIMNKSTWSAFKAVQYNNSYAVDIFEGLEVLFNNSIKAFSAAQTDEVYAIVGDIGEGALANFPNGEEITIKFDDLSLAEQDLVKIVGRQYVGLGVVAPDAFVKIIK